MRWLKARLQKRRERRLHDDRDYACRYWWGDRGGYSLLSVRCGICNPNPTGLPHAETPDLSSLFNPIGHDGPCGVPLEPRTKAVFCRTQQKDVEAVRVRGRWLCPDCDAELIKHWQRGDREVEPGRPVAIGVEPGFEPGSTVLFRGSEGGRMWPCTNAEYVLLTEKCTGLSHACEGRIRYGELTDDANTHWHVKRGVALVSAAEFIRDNRYDRED